MAGDAAESHTLAVHQQVAVFNLDGADAKCVLLFVNCMTSPVFHLNLHAVEIGNVEAPQTRRVDFEFYFGLRSPRF